MQVSWFRFRIRCFLDSVAVLSPSWCMSIWSFSSHMSESNKPEIRTERTEMPWKQTPPEKTTTEFVEKRTFCFVLFYFDSILLAHFWCQAIVGAFSSCCVSSSNGVSSRFLIEFFIYRALRHISLIFCREWRLNIPVDSIVSLWRPICMNRFQLFLANSSNWRSNTTVNRIRNLADGRSE